MILVAQIFPDIYLLNYATRNLYQWTGSYIGMPILFAHSPPWYIHLK